MTANGNPSHSLVVTQPFPVGRCSKNRFLEPPSILAVTQLGYVVTHPFPLRLPCLPVNYSGLSLFILQKLFLGSWRGSAQRPGPQTLTFLLLRSSCQENPRRGPEQPLELQINLSQTHTPLAALAEGYKCSNSSSLAFIVPYTLGQTHLTGAVQFQACARFVWSFLSVLTFS